MKYSSYYLFIGFCLISVIGVQCQDKKPSTVQNAIENSTEKIKSTTTNKSSTTEISKTENGNKKNDKPPKLVCPDKDAPRPFFSLRCTITPECAFLGKGLLCCHQRCLKGIPPPKPEPMHSPALFGLIGRVCPKEPIPELLDVKECQIDSECIPRICCPEKLTNGDIIGYCRTPEPILDNLPGGRQLSEPLRAIASYMQCTPPPPPVLDLFPKPCQSPLDCFPNLCCQEKGKKYCRPPKRSLLALIAGLTQRIVPEDAAKKIIARITQ